MLGSIAFNLLVNAACSFGFSCAIVWLVLSGFRVGPDRWQLLLLALPWVKVAWDTARGIPEGSFFWLRLQGFRQDLGSLQLGLGANHTGPRLELRLGAKVAEASYPQSVAELLDGGLARLWPPLPTLIACVLLSISALLVMRRLIGWVRHARALGRVPLGSHRLPRGWLPPVLVVVDEGYRGAPYAVGILRPRIVLPGQQLASLQLAEREACLLHERAHISHGDTLWSPLLSLLTDAFWFLPGARWVLRRFHAVIELRADAAAVRLGASAETLASALVSTGELLHARASAGVGLVRERLLARRVRRLLQPTAEPRPRAGFQHRFARVLITVVVTTGVLQSIFLGNQPPN